MNLLKLLLAALLIACGTCARATDLVLDPQANEAGVIVHTVCSSTGADGAPSCPEGVDFLSGENDFTIQINSTGFFNSIADVQLVPSGLGFYFSSFDYQLQEPSGPGFIASAHGTGVYSQPPNAALTAIATYHLVVDWTLQAVPANGVLDSASYSIRVLTSAAPVALAVPEPATLLLVAIALATAIGFRLRAR